MEEWNTLLDTKYKMKYWSRYDNICEVHVKKLERVVKILSYSD